MAITSHWVGRFEDILAGKPGDYRIKLLNNTLRQSSDKPGQGNADCGYSDLEVLPDGGQSSRRPTSNMPRVRKNIPS